LAELAKQGDAEALLMEPWLAFNGGSYDSGGSTSSGGRRTPESYQRNLRATHKLIHQKNPRITSLDWRDCLEAEQPGPDDFVFVDGPYIGCNVGAYSPESISPCELVEFLKSATFNWILTEYRQPIYLEAFGAPIFEKAVRLRTPYCANTGGQERRIECIWTNVGKDPAKRDSVTVQVKPVPPDRKDTYYCGLQLDALLDEIKQCAIAITAARNQMSAEMRMRLLPALLALKKRTYRKHPGFYDTLRAINLNPDTVRQWFYRGRTADEIIEVMEEEPTKPVVVRKGPRRESGDVRDLYIDHLEKVVKAVLANKITLAKRLATEYLRVREENRV